MKTEMRWFGLMILLTIGLLALGSNAQAQSRPVLKAKVPFEFNIGDTHFSSGELVVWKIGHTDVLMGRRGTEVAIFQSIPQRKPNRDSSLYTVHFRVYGGHYFLSEVWEGTEGHQLHRSPTEIRLAKAMGEQGTEVPAVGK